MSKKAILAFPNRADDTNFNTTTLSGGSWSTGLPLDNLKDERLSLPARSTSTDVEDTQFKIDLGKSFRIQVIAILGHNLSLGATYRVWAYSDSGYTNCVYDSLQKLAWPIVFPFGMLEWEDNNFWSLTWAKEVAKNYPIFSLLVLDPTVGARYWKIELIDEDNADGFIEISRFFIASGWQPKHNIEWGYSIDWTAIADIEETLGGQAIIEDRASYRTAKITFGNLTDDEANAVILDMQKELGRSGQVFFVPNPEDNLHVLRRSFLSRINSTTGIEHIFLNRHRNTIELREVL